MIIEITKLMNDTTCSLTRFAFSFIDRLSLDSSLQSLSHTQTYDDDDDDNDDKEVYMLMFIIHFRFLNKKLSYHIDRATNA